MDEYGMTVGLDETAGGAASLGPDAARYASTAVTIPAPRQTSPVDALTPQWDGQFPKTSGDALSALAPLSAGRNLSDGVFTRPVAKPAMPAAEDSLTQLRERMLDAVYGRRATEGFFNALPEDKDRGATGRLVESLLKSKLGGGENLLDKGRNQDNRQMRENPPEYLQRTGLPEFTRLRGADGSERNGYDYNGVRVELPAGFDTSDARKTAAQVSFSNQMVDWMTNDDDEMEV